jgi:hypothetical protein
MKGIAMKRMNALLIVAVSMSFFVMSGGEVSAQTESQKQNRRKARWDGVKMVADVGGVVLGVATLNPVIVGVSSGDLLRNTYQLGKHSLAARRDTTSYAPQAVAQPESLVAVPGRPGYFYYPSNPNQLYFDATAVKQIKVLIANKAKDGQTIRYSISGTAYEVPPGYGQLLVAPAGSMISFDRGDKLGIEMFTLTDGTFEFRKSEAGWRFYATDPNLPNVANLAKAKSESKPTETSKPPAVVR